MTPARFPHSDTPGSTLGCQLPRAYRRLLRPSSALDAKASTMRPSQLVTTKPHNPTKTRRPAEPDNDPPQRTTQSMHQPINQHTPHNKQTQQTKQPTPPHAAHQPTRAGTRHTRGEPFQMLASTIQISNNNPTPPHTHHQGRHRHGRDGSHTRHQPTQLIPQNPNSVPTDTPHTRGRPWLLRFVLPHLQVTPSTPGHLWSQTGVCSLERR
jgi:hypothetical protein